MADDNVDKGWVVRRKSENEVELVLPDGMYFTSHDLTIADIIQAIEKHRVLKRGAGSKGGPDEVKLRCCDPSSAIAAI